MFVPIGIRLFLLLLLTSLLMPLSLVYAYLIKVEGFSIITVGQIPIPMYMALMLGTFGCLMVLTFSRWVIKGLGIISLPTSIPH